MAYKHLVFLNRKYFVLKLAKFSIFFLIALIGLDLVVSDLFGSGLIYSEPSGRVNAKGYIGLLAVPLLIAFLWKMACYALKAPMPFLSLSNDTLLVNRYHYDDPTELSITSIETIELIEEYGNLFIVISQSKTDTKPIKINADCLAHNPLELRKLINSIPYKQ